MKLKLNKEFAARHLFVVLLMAALGCWFGYDAFVGYPSKTPRELYMSAHDNAPPQSEEEAQKFYSEAIPRQKQFMVLAFLASLIVGAHLFAVSRLRLEFDDESFTWNGRRHEWKDVESVDDGQWEKKRISKVKVSGATLVLDAWHHVGAKELHEKITANKP